MINSKLEREVSMKSNDVSLQGLNGKIIRIQCIGQDVPDIVPNWDIGKGHLYISVSDCVSNVSGAYVSFEVVYDELRKLVRGTLSSSQFDFDDEYNANPVETIPRPIIINPAPEMDATQGKITTRRTFPKQKVKDLPKKKLPPWMPVKKG